MQNGGYYTEIDEMPLHNWLKCQSGKLAYCRLVWNKGTDIKDAAAWEALNDDFIAKVGLGKSQEEYYRLIDQETNAICDYLATPEEDPKKRFKLNRIDALKAKISEIRSSSTDFDIEKTLIILSGNGPQINARDISVLRFHKMIELHGEKSRQNKPRN